MTVKQAGAAVSIVAGSLGIWGGVVKVRDHIFEQWEQRLVSIQRTNDLEQRVCKLEKRRWYKGECLDRR